MPTLGVDVKVSLATDKTRQSLEDFYRGIRVEAVQVLPYAYLSEKGEQVYNLENASFVLFIGDVYDNSDPFDVTLITLNDEQVYLQQTNFFMMNASNLKALKVESSVEDKVGYKVYYG